MPKQFYLTMCIDRRLKQRLRELASEQGQNMSAFVTKELDQLLAQPMKGRAGKSSRRRVGRTYLMLRIGKGLKTKLDRLAAQDYRTLTDFIEIALSEVVNPPQVKSTEFSLQAVTGRNSALPPMGPRPARIAISITRQLRADLQRLAKNDYRTLANFIELKLYQKVDVEYKSAAKLPRRQTRLGRLSVRISGGAKARLLMFANLEYRTITDFVEIRLRQAIACQRQIPSKFSGSTC